MNVITLDGNLTEDPSELREVTVKEATQKVRTFRLAHTHYKKTLFIDVEVWNGWAENLRATKGSPVVVQGELHCNSFTGKDGKERSKLYVRAREVKLLVLKPKATSGTDSDE